MGSAGMNWTKIDLQVREAGPADASDVVRVIHRAFAGRPELNPPSTALAETPQTVTDALLAHSGLLATVDGEPAGTMLFDDARELGHPMLGLRRVSVLPQWQGRGVATAMVGVAEDVARERGLAGVRLVARRELAATVQFWRRRGYADVARGAHDYTMVKQFDAGRVTVRVPTGEAMRTLGRALAGELAAGDLVLLAGELGAGKTTLTQGIGAGLEVTGDIISPTFVISRLHASAGDGPMLVHVDAYRLRDGAELDDLDLDAAADVGVTVVEWGEGMAEELSDERLLVRIDRVSEPTACAADVGVEATDVPEPRLVRFQGVGSRWTDGALTRVVRRYAQAGEPADEPDGWLPIIEGSAHAAG